LSKLIVWFVVKVYSIIRTFHLLIRGYKGTSSLILAKETQACKIWVSSWALHATRTWMLVAFNRLTCTNHISRKCPSPSFPRMTWWRQQEPGTSWLRFSSRQSVDESQGAHTTWISSSYQCPLQ
jgi:hypothetical protein